ncbi:hypothetical protein [Nocardia nova]|uniref:hypothetical protein n=1 Tax=Nocardia nova TaxID=37330 RepID=UPI0033F7197C
MVMKGDQAAWNTAATWTAQYLGELEGQLRLIDTRRTEFATSIRSASTGQEVQTQFMDAHAKGKVLASHLQTILDTLKEQGAHVDASDLDGKSKLARANMNAGNDGHLDVTAGSGPLPAPKVDVASI